MTENKDTSPVDSEHELEWVDETIPRSRHFGDTYFSQYGGLEETSQVYIGWNELPRRWPQLTHCTIAELGFGTGLNFLETLRQWRLHCPQASSFHFISVEAWPLKKPDLRKALTRWPELELEASALLELWQTDQKMLDVLYAENVQLTVYFDDALVALQRHAFEADAWYLDGFAPSRNPQMWSAELMQEVFGHTKTGGTFTTYTSAGWVKRNLQGAGFEVEKLAGFAAKREMLRGRKA